ncbi:MAG: 6-pyruvoyl-tetrahydropterin synthase-related protein [Candidatus Micrarchaeia archaeon]
MKNPFEQDGPLNIYRVAITLVFIVSFLLKLYFATRYPLIAGMDAGYYVMHIQDVFTHGYPQVSDPPIAFYIGAFFAHLAGDLFLGFKVAISLFSAAICFPIYKIAKYITRDRAVAVFAGFLASFSTSNMFIMGDLFKNTIGLFFGAWFIYLSIKSIRETSTRNTALAIVAFVLMLGTHFSSSAYLLFSMTPLLLLLPIYSFMHEKRITTESLKCFAIMGGIGIAALAVLIIKPGLLGDYSIGPVGLEYLDDGPPGKSDSINLSMFSMYSFFSLLAMLGLYSAYRIDPKWALLFVPWIAVSFLLTQPLFVDNSWVFRFEMNTYIPISLLAGLGAFYFRKEKTIFYAVMLLMALHTLYMFMDSGLQRTPLISMQEFQSLSGFAEAHPGAQVFGPHGGLAYWVQAAGLETTDDPSPAPGKYAMFSIQRPKPGGMGGVAQTISIPESELNKISASGSVSAEFGNFVLVETTGLRKPPRP